MRQPQGNEEAFFSEEILGKLRSRIGPKRRLENTFNDLASKEAIRKFADGIGDPNPLWFDERVCKKDTIWVPRG